MKTGFSSHFEHKDDSCSDMAEKQKGFQKGSKRRPGQDPKMFGLIYKSKRAVYGSAMLEKNMAEQNIAIQKKIHDQKTSLLPYLFWSNAEVQPHIEFLNLF